MDYDQVAGIRLAIQDGEQVQVLNFTTLNVAFEFYRGAAEEGHKCLWIDLPGGTRLSKALLDQLMEWDDSPAAASLRLLSDADLAGMATADLGVMKPLTSYELPSDAKSALVAVSGIEVAEHTFSLAQVLYASATSCSWHSSAVECWPKIYEASDSIIIKVGMLSLAMWMLVKLLYPHRKK